ncbi:MAG: HEAT repeat domain-containing protein [Planctomycetota bacterium]
MSLRKAAFRFALTSLLALPLFAKPTPAEWKQIEGEARRAFSTTDGDARVKAAQAVGAANCVDGVKLLVLLINMPDKALESAEAARDKFEPEFLAAVERINKFARQGKGMVAQSEADIFEKKKLEMDTLNEKCNALLLVPHAVAEALTKTRDADAVKWLVEEGLKDKNWRARMAVAGALGYAPADNALVTPAVVAVATEKDGRVRGAAIEALGRRGAKEHKDLILKALEDERWQVRVSACEALGVLQLRETVGPLIARMEVESGRLLEDLDKALKELTGLTFNADALGWKGWWQINKEKWESGELVKKEEPKKEDPKDGGKDAGGKDDGKDVGGGGLKPPDPPKPPDPAPNPPADPAPGGTTVEFYGIRTKSKNLVFVVDVSGSMAEPAKYVPNADSGAPAGQGPKGKRKIDIARWELSKAIGGLPEDARFNIITFSSDVKVYSPAKMLVATKPTKVQAQQFAEKLEPQEATNIYDALEKAFELAGGAKMQVDENYKVSVDTILFMTDGKPTIGKSVDPTVIADKVKVWNTVRKIRVHCVGIGDHDEKLMQRLADESGGMYVKR